MNTQQTYALLALQAYEASAKNTLPLPPDWTEVLPQPTGTDGFAYSVYRNTATNEIVISFRGTDSFLSGDMLTNLGLSLSQETQAAAVYARVLKDYGAAANITFTGHSLGGGLAGTMAVWFNRTAVVFDPAPAQITATYGPSVSSVIASLGADAPQSIKDYYANITAQFAARESKVTSYFAPGSAVYSISTAGNTITGAGQDNPVQFGIDNMGSLGGRIDMHSQALLTAGLLSDPFKTSTVAVQRALPRIMDKAFYAYATSGTERNFLIDLIRSEQSAVTGLGKLTHFATDLNKLGTNIAGLNVTAQDALIAQGIEWYYWQGTDYAGQDFFVNNVAQPNLLQYTTAQGEGLRNRAEQGIRSTFTPGLTQPTPPALGHALCAVGTSPLTNGTWSQAVPAQRLPHARPARAKSSSAARVQTPLPGATRATSSWPGTVSTPSTAGSTMTRCTAAQALTSTTLPATLAATPCSMPTAWAVCGLTACS